MSQCVISEKCERSLVIQQICLCDLSGFRADDINEIDMLSDTDPHLGGR